MSDLTAVIAAHWLRNSITDDMEHDDNDWSTYCQCGHRIADTTATDIEALHRAHVVAALRESRTVRTVGELDALPVGSIAVEPVGHAWIKHDPALWHCSCDGTDVEWASSLLVQDSHLPLQIVHRPDEDGAL